MSDFIEWLDNLSLFQWYVLFVLMELVFGLTDMFVKDKGAEYRALKDDAPGWAPEWANRVVALLSIVIVAVAWPVVTVITLYKLTERVIVWGADKYLNWSTRRFLRKVGITDEDLGGSVYGPAHDDDSITVMFDAEGNVVQPEGKWSHE
ncbi:hypothetical protein [Rhodococcus phage REQ1]|uniref:hypothetical protein n=1 Tax=Rhodococcus phage REQ1 TaxID=1109712 RepID=UPI00023EEC5A|nr:hypothetical protein RoPhREQ1_gp56 [Rhodococcus phage REQ1]AEV52052.1 hypothetical protein [Rhodococcus phage REQ1]